MEFKATLQDGTGQHEITLDMGLYKSEQGFVGALNSQFPTPQGMPTASEQLINAYPNHFFGVAGSLQPYARENGYGVGFANGERSNALPHLRGASY